jgi:hypothetical protein
MHDLILIKMVVARFVGTGRFLVRILSYEINESPIKEDPRLFLTKHYSFNHENKYVNFKVAITDVRVYKRNPWHWVAETLGSTIGEPLF